METLRLENEGVQKQDKSAQSGGIIVDAEWYIIKILFGSLGDIIIYRPRAINYDITSETGQYSYNI